MYLGSNRMSRLRLEFRTAVSKALVIVVVVVVVVAEASVVDTPATTMAVVATVVVTASEKFDSVLTLLLFTYKPVTQELNYYKDTKPKMSSLLVFNRVYRLEIQSVMLVFSTHHCELLPLKPSLL